MLIISPTNDSWIFVERPSELHEFSFDLNIQCGNESEGGSYSEQAVSGLQPSIFLGGSSLYDLGNIDAVVSWDVLVADPSSNAESKAWWSNTHSEIRLQVNTSAVTCERPSL